MNPSAPPHVRDVLAVSPTAAWLEFADPILAEPLRPVGGMITEAQRPGIGLVWDDRAVQTYRVA